MSERQREETERAFERHAKQTFDRSVRDLDSATRSRLAQARRAALEHADERESRRGWTWSLAPAGAVAASVLAVAFLLWQNGPRPELGLQPTAFQDMEILLGEDGVEIEMLDEEIEFYAWLEEQPELTTPAATGDGVG
jgi:uncharacterized protein DUF3619